MGINRVFSVASSPDKLDAKPKPSPRPLRTRSKAQSQSGSRQSKSQSGSPTRAPSNDSVPEEEMLLAAALAAAKERNLKFCAGRRFRDRHSQSCQPDEAVACCAMGALYLAGLDRKIIIGGIGYGGYVTTGNDSPIYWSTYDYLSPVHAARFESLGWAFRQAMMVDE